MKLTGKHSSLGLSTTHCNWILDFLTHRPQTVRIGGHTSSTLVLNTGAPSGLCAQPPSPQNQGGFDFRKMEAKTHTVYIGGAEVEQVNSFKFLGISITENLTRSSHFSTKKAQKRLYFYRKLKRAKLPCQVLIHPQHSTM